MNFIGIGPATWIIGASHAQKRSVPLCDKRTLINSAFAKRCATAYDAARQRRNSVNQVVKFEPGQKVYSDDGEVGTYVSALATGGHAVQPMYESHEDDGDEPEFESWHGTVTTWQRVHAAAPRHIVDAVITEKTETARKLRAEIYELEEKARKLRNDETMTKQRLAEVEALRYLDDVFAGRITHYAVKTDGSRGDWVVLSHEMAMKMGGDESSYDARRLTLYCRDLKTAQWTFFAPSRDYARECTCFPYKSEEEARAKVKAMITAQLAGQVEKFNSYYAKDIVDNARRYDVDVPAVITDKLLAEKTSHAQHAVAKAKEDLTKAIAELQALSPQAVEFDSLVQAGVALDRR